MEGPLQTLVKKSDPTNSQSLLVRLLDTTVCTVCQDYMFVPMMTQCGHNFCYECLSTWLLNSNNLSCPTCRESLETKPCLNSAVQRILFDCIDQMTQIDAGDASLADELRVLVLSRDEYMKSFKASGANFEAVFGKTTRAVADADDGVLRCAECHWELADDDTNCPHCGYRIAGQRPPADAFDREEYSDGELEADMDRYRANSMENGDDSGMEDVYDELDSRYGNEDEYEGSFIATDDEEGLEEQGSNDDLDSDSDGLSDAPEERPIFSSDDEKMASGDEEIIKGGGLSSDESEVEELSARTILSDEESDDEHVEVTRKRNRVVLSDEE